MVRCSDCGLLAFRHDLTKRVEEATHQDRKTGWLHIEDMHGQQRKCYPSPVCVIGCKPFEKTVPDEVAIEIATPHKCNRWEMYVAGMGPVDTWRNIMNDQFARELEHRVEMRHWINIAVCGAIAFFGALASVAAGIIGAIATVAFTKIVERP